MGLQAVRLESQAVTHEVAGRVQRVAGWDAWD